MLTSVTEFRVIYKIFYSLHTHYRIYLISFEIRILIDSLVMANRLAEFLQTIVSKIMSTIRENELTAQTTGAAAEIIGAVGPALGSSPTKFPGNPISKF